MPKIDKTDMENISLIRKELKLKKVTTIRIKKGSYEIELSSNNTSSPINLSPISKSENNIIPNKVHQDKIEEENIIKCPMVGVAYLSSDPSSPPFVKVGQHIKKDDTLLLIEAMKTFNEVKAPRSGVIKKIIVLSSQPVEFGDDLIILE